MRVAMWYSNRDVRLEQMPVPQVGPGEILVRIQASGLCGSDGMEWYRLHKAPLVLGHEVSGEVAEVGRDVRRFRVGDRVAVAHHVPCNTCHHCLNGHHAVCDTLQSTGFDPGGFSEFVRVPALQVDRGVFPLPDEVTHEEGTFAEPLGCVVRGQRMAGLRPGRSVFVAGCGIAAQLHIMTARALGAGRIIAADSIDFRLRTAQSSGADTVLSEQEDLPERIRGINGGLLADVVIVCRETLIPQALRCVERGGTVLFFAAAGEEDRIPLTVNELFWRTEVTLTSSYAAPPADTVTALHLIRSRRVPVADLITHRLALAETGLGFHMLTHPVEQNSMKIVIQPQR